ncbi:polysaccharide deacetylase family protein [Butyrivibrio sp. NC2007]|uniref:polysaccharide deacetylase family protein n=1 Tax=Butyrivibrio sp. NC2007 TaxID=1280683 RepID=UPI0003B3B95A|nr:polysaccharide deacetylase family protein [Butyrivibrio sp. NC2007]
MESKQYSKRIRYLRRLIITTVAAACLIPTCICVILAIRYDRLHTEYEKSMADLEWYREQFGSERDILATEAEPDGEDSNIVETTSEGMDVDYATVDVSGAQNPEDIEGTRYVYLTFDDGPSTYTDEILDILEQHNVKATFFVCGKPNAKYTDLYKRIVNDGHTLGMHSYSHKYSELYASLDSFKEDTDKLRIFLYETTGVWASFYRFPGGSSNTVSKVDMHELTDYLESSNVTFFDWNVSAGDDKAGANKDTIYANIVNNVPRFKHCVVLMHDAADKKSTVEALPEIIEAIQAMDDTVIVPITEDTLPVQHIN